MYNLNSRYIKWRLLNQSIILYTISGNTINDGADDEPCNFEAEAGSIAVVVVVVVVVVIVVVVLQLMLCRIVYMSRLMRKPIICVCEKQRNCEADQRLCFRYTDSNNPLLSTSKISSLWPSSVIVQPSLCWTCSRTTLLVFPRSGSSMLKSSMGFLLPCRQFFAYGFYKGSLMKVVQYGPPFLFECFYCLQKI